MPTKRKRRTTIPGRKPKGRGGLLVRMSNRVTASKSSERKRKKMFGPTRPRGAPQNPLSRIIQEFGPRTPTQSAN